MLSYQTPVSQANKPAKQESSTDLREGTVKSSEINRSATPSSRSDQKNVSQIARKIQPTVLDLTLFCLLPEHARAIDVADGVLDSVGAAVVLNRFLAGWHGTVVVYNDVATW
jgi:hypothetical protein